MRLFSAFFCKHRRTRCVHGDEIIRRNFRRIACLDCERSLKGPLPAYCYVTGDLHASALGQNRRTPEGGGFEHLIITSIAESSVRAEQQLRDALADRDRVYDAARAEIDNLDRARANGTIYTYGQIQERLRAALTPPNDTTTTTALAEDRRDTPPQSG